MFQKKLRLCSPKPPSTLRPIIKFSTTPNPGTPYSTLASLLKENEKKNIKIRGWIKRTRVLKNFAFIELNDGSTPTNLQVVVPSSIVNNTKFGFGDFVEATGVYQETSRKQAFEVQCESLDILGPNDSTNPLQPKEHSLEFLREHLHLRPKTSYFSSAFRIRSEAARYLREHLQSQEFYEIHSPIITSNDCEGGSSVFQVTAPKTDKGNTQYFNKTAFLSVSGQLQAEALAMGLGRVYTFGPTFRAEESDTNRHLAEFWMLEPEWINVSLSQDMDLAESLVKSATTSLLTHHLKDLQFLDQFWTKYPDPSKALLPSPKGYLHRLEELVSKPFARITYQEALTLLNSHGSKAPGKGLTSLTYGDDLSSDHERYLCEGIFGSPVFVSHYPSSLKPFYMKSSQEHAGTVENFDLLVAGIGELAGGSIREDSCDILTANLQRSALNLDDWKWYLELRKFGGAPHGGFGLGFERFVQILTNSKNIRDSIPFPRYVGQCKQ